MLALKGHNPQESFNRADEFYDSIERSSRMIIHFEKGAA